MRSNPQGAATKIGALAGPHRVRSRGLRPALHRARCAAVALLLVGVAALAACGRTLPQSKAPSKAPSAPFRVTGGQLVFEENSAIGSSCRGSDGFSGNCFVRVGDGLVGAGWFTKPQAFLSIRPDGQADTREGPLRFAAGDARFDSEHGSTPEMWGRWPDDFFAEAWNPISRHLALVRVRGASTTDEGTFPRILAIAPWTQGRIVGVVKDASGWKRLVWDAAGRHDELIPGYAAHARLPDSLVVEGEKERTCEGEDLVPWEATVLPSGELIVLGLACAVDPAQRAGHLVIDRWSTDGATPAIDRLPTYQRPRWASLCFSAAGEVHVVMSNFVDRPPANVGGGAIIATRRPEGWTLSPPLAGPGDAAVQRPGVCAVAPDGAVWLNVTHDSRTLEESKRHDGSDFHPASLVRLPAGGAWSEVALPSPWTHPKLIAALSDGSLWLAARGPSRTLGLHALGANTPDDYEFPQTRRAIEGNPAIVGARFITAIESGRRVFGAVARDRAQAEQIAALVRSALRGTTPRIVCAAPTVQREHPFRSGPR